MNVLKRITARAKAIRRQSGGSWKAAIKKAGAEYRGQTKPPRRVSAVKIVEKGQTKAARPAAVYLQKRDSGGQFKGTRRLAAARPSEPVRKPFTVAVLRKVWRPRPTRSTREYHLLFKGSRPRIVYIQPGLFELRTTAGTMQFTYKHPNFKDFHITG